MLKLTKAQYQKEKEKIAAYPDPVNESGYEYKWLPSMDDIQKYIINGDPQKVWPFVEYILDRAMKFDLTVEDEMIIERLDRYLDENIQII